MANAIGVGLLVLMALSFVVLAHDQEVRETQSLGQIKSNTSYKHIWPELRFSWKILVGTLIAFIGAAFGSVGGIGGGGFFVPMLTLIIGFDQKSATAISTCMITGAATATVYYNLWQRHPTLELPIIDYDLALLFQPMLMVGISIGVSLNVVLPEWMITFLLIAALLGTTTKSFLKGVEAWKKETTTKKNSGDASRNLQSNGGGAGLPANGVTEIKEAKRVSTLLNVSWNQFGVVVAVWIAILALQISMQYVNKCSVSYWLLEVAQIPVVVAASSYEAVKLYKGQRSIASAGESGTIWRVHKLLYYCACGIIGGIVGGVLGFGGGFIMGPLFLGIGLPPQVSSATSTFIMTFSSSMSVVEFYLLKRFPIPYALYYTAVATLSAIIGQHIAGKVIKALARASLIIFVLAFTMLVSALSLGGVGLVHMVKQIERKEYMGFESMCSSKS